MILVVDIGNSNVVIGGVEGEKILFEARVPRLPKHPMNTASI